MPSMVAVTMLSLLSYSWNNTSPIGISDVSIVAMLPEKETFITLLALSHDTNAT